MSLHEMSLKYIKKKSIFNIFLKNHTKNFMFSTGTSLASKTPKKFKKVSVSYLVPVLLVEKEPKKNAKMNLVPATESTNKKELNSFWRFFSTKSNGTK